MCQQYNTNSKLIAQTRGSKFTKFQEIKVQELPDQVPTGHIPRMMTVHLLGEMTRTCSPGEEVIISGIFLPVPYTGYKAIKAGLTADTYMEATSVRKAKQRYQEYQLTPELVAEIDRCSREPNTYSKLANSIAPEIFGMEDVKKALLLQLVGASDRSLSDGLHIRGDMHVCLMGDPGVAKSQLLKHIAKLAPRGVYTTGKGSSGVGLTASVIRDQARSAVRPIPRPDPRPFSDSASFTSCPLGSCMLTSRILEYSTPLLMRLSLLFVPSRLTLSVGAVYVRAGARGRRPCACRSGLQPCTPSPPLGILRRPLRSRRPAVRPPSPR
jgi:hypothetical protein